MGSPVCLSWARIYSFTGTHLFCAQDSSTASNTA